MKVDIESEHPERTMDNTDIIVIKYNMKAVPNATSFSVICYLIYLLVLPHNQVLDHHKELQDQVAPRDWQEVLP